MGDLPGSKPLLLPSPGLHQASILLACGTWEGKDPSQVGACPEYERTGPRCHPLPPALHPVKFVGSTAVSCLGSWEQGELWVTAYQEPPSPASLGAGRPASEPEHQPFGGHIMKTLKSFGTSPRSCKT